MVDISVIIRFRQNTIFEDIDLITKFDLPVFMSGKKKDLSLGLTFLQIYADPLLTEEIQGGTGFIQQKNVGIV